ncbi:conserved Plasmodium protein, unknown function [Plasmodium knowlesi strain H]|uniref:Uncharacterized protein n=3 Tax=Plasmodium knowlesi TaxID=5850 RepID=A0A5K1U0V2_PLAKH|nr:conserved Plasmodium protein, unknown function [Plasmodium knowlesi strain H]OTN64316.1 Uncharacterized protein PKNOH_S130172100 [Plasmodium knowlesi]CAA9988889.1 conserved Plasmodium protein, unknown function [Plasmodium knowlesi strain H]SBO24729.1 conserved Plasmodium protein, unknown function [Plasmodium knowlesi strain H]SBO27998.1 conserved Plasmodium protein, unknown function [Plasmodium knowlesi strain H]VVS78363.1 conserved Plasmodium protein, unknown function [Plasmodium knowlesi |eukprot:XP_002261236.1 hypothetical protein, conserved in Plasmodium species [Plasmodium knowlesi strain H]
MNIKDLLHNEIIIIKITEFLTILEIQNLIISLRINVKTNLYFMNECLSILMDKVYTGEDEEEDVKENSGVRDNVERNALQLPPSSTIVISNLTANQNDQHSLFDENETSERNSNSTSTAVHNELYQNGEIIDLVTYEEERVNNLAERPLEEGIKRKTKSKKKKYKNFYEKNVKKVVIMRTIREYLNIHFYSKRKRQLLQNTNSTNEGKRQFRKIWLYIHLYHEIIDLKKKFRNGFLKIKNNQMVHKNRTKRFEPFQLFKINGNFYSIFDAPWVSVYFQLCLNAICIFCQQKVDRNSLCIFSEKINLTVSNKLLLNYFNHIIKSGESNLHVNKENSSTQAITDNPLEGGTGEFGGHPQKRKKTSVDSIEDCYKLDCASHYGEHGGDDSDKDMSKEDNEDTRSSRESVDNLPLEEKSNIISMKNVKGSMIGGHNDSFSLCDANDSISMEDKEDSIILRDMDGRLSLRDTNDSTSCGEGSTFGGFSWQSTNDDAPFQHENAERIQIREEFLAVRKTHIFCDDCSRILEYRMNIMSIFEALKKDYELLQKLKIMTKTFKMPKHLFCMCNYFFFKDKYILYFKKVSSNLQSLRRILRKKLIDNFIFTFKLNFYKFVIRTLLTCDDKEVYRNEDIFLFGFYIKYRNLLSMFNSPRIIYMYYSFHVILEKIKKLQILFSHKHFLKLTHALHFDVIAIIEKLKRSDAKRIYRDISKYIYDNVNEDMLSRSTYEELYVYFFQCVKNYKFV